MLGGENAEAVDVAGGHGAVRIALAQAFLHIKVVVHDLPNVVEDGKAQLEGTIGALDQSSVSTHDRKNRVSFMAQDMFTV